MSRIDYAHLVIDAYDNVPGHEAALLALLPREQIGPAPVLIVAAALSGCTGNYGADRWVHESEPTAVRQHSGALGKALVACVWQPRAQKLRGYDGLWPQIKLARGHVGVASEEEEQAQLCMTAAALMSCQDGDDWQSLYDFQGKYGQSGTCARIVETVDARRDDSWFRESAQKYQAMAKEN